MNTTFPLNTPENHTPARPPLKRDAFITHLNVSEIDLENPNHEDHQGVSIEMTELNKQTCSSSSSSDFDQGNEKTANPTSGTMFEHGSDASAVLASDPENQAVVRPSLSDATSISRRIVRNHALKYMVQLPEIDGALSHGYQYTSIITGTGLYQLDDKFTKFKLVLTVETLAKTLPALWNTIDMTARDDSSVYDDLTLDELHALEDAIREHRGRTVIGYSDNERAFLTLIGAGQWAFPPLPEEYPTRVLHLIHRPFVGDLTLSCRSVAQALLLFEFLVVVYLQYDTKNPESESDFYYQNSHWFLLVAVSTLTINVFLLRSPLFDKEKMFALINRFMLIEKSVISVSKNWTTYGALVLPKKIIAFGLLGVMLYGLRRGYFSNNELYTTSVINVANKTGLKTLWNGFCYALTTGSFVALGSEFFVLDVIFDKHRDDDVHGFALYDQDVAIIQYMACAITFLCHVARYPNAPYPVQKFGRYASNISNTMGNVMLDNYAIFQIITNVMGLWVGDNISDNQIGLLTVFYGLQVVVFLYCFVTAFPTTPDLPQFSLELDPAEPTIQSRCAEKIEQLTQLFHKLNAQLPSLHAIPSAMERFSGSVGERLRFFSTTAAHNQASPSQTITVTNPLYGMS